VSVYYTVETGLQENIFIFDHDKPSADSIIVECKESKHKACSTTVLNSGHIVMELERLRVHRSLLKKIEIGVDYIQNDNAKYQISDIRVMRVAFKDSIQCEIVKFTELEHETCKNYYQGKRVISPSFNVHLKLGKHP
jgi:hypothetical protein